MSTRTLLVVATSVLVMPATTKHRLEFQPELTLAMAILMVEMRSSRRDQIAGRPCAMAITDFNTNTDHVFGAGNASNDFAGEDYFSAGNFDGVFAGSDDFGAENSNQDFIGGSYLGTGNASSEFTSDDDFGS